METRHRLRSDVLARAIESSRLSQNRWAQRLGLSKSYLSQLVNGHRRDPSPEVRERLMRAFDLTLEELFEVEHGPLLPTPRSRRGGLGRRLGALVDGVRLDLRAALRGLGRRPLPALFAIVALTLGVGANTLVFSLVRGVLLAPLPWADVDRVVRVYEEHPERGLRRFGVAPANYLDWRSADSFEHLAAFDRRDLNLERDVTTLRVASASVDGEIFEALGIRPLRGRLLEPSRDGAVKDDDADVVVITEALRRRLFGPAERAVGATLVLDGRATTVVGVVATEEAFPPGVEAWMPLGLSAREAAERDGRWLKVVGRLRPLEASASDASPVDAARAEMSLVAERLEREHPTSNEGWTIALEPLTEVQLGRARRPLALLWAATFAVLVVACVDVALLTLARTAARRRELAVRAALGAGGGRLVRQLLVEALVIAGAGAVCGVALAFGGLRLVRGFAADALPRLEAVALDPWVLAFTLGLAVAATLAASLLPAVAASRRARLASPRAVGEDSRAQGLLIGAQVALASVLLIVAALVGRSLQEVLAVDLGFEPKGLIEARIEPPLGVDLRADVPVGELFTALQEERVRMAAVYERLLGELGTVAGVAAAAAINRPPLDGRAWFFQVGLEGRGGAGDDEPPSAQARVVTPGYFDVAGIARLAGRDVAWSDRSRARRVAVVDRRAADAFFGGDAIGRTFRFLGPPEEFADWTRYEVVGVVDAVRQSDLESSEPPTIYFPLEQAMSGHFDDWGMTLFARTSPTTELSPEALAPALREAAGRVLPTLPIFSIAPTADRVGRVVASRRLQTSLCGAFAALTLLLAAVGLYGVVAGAVERRRRELGLRAALGAAPGQLVASTCRRGLRPVAWGLAAGLVLALLAGRWLGAMLYGVDRYDPIAFTSALVVLSLVALVAAWLPARRAAHADPTATLREE